MSNLQEASDFFNNVSISARRFEESPFIERTRSPEMIRGVYAGRFSPFMLVKIISKSIGVFAKKL